MKLIAEKLGRKAKCDQLRYVRADGSETLSSMPRQGTLPHDLVHYVVESALPLRHGFLSLVAAGSEASFDMRALHDGGNPDIETQSVQAEAIVEALQSQLWSGSFDIVAFSEGVRSACAARKKPAFEFAGIDACMQLFDSALELNARWELVPFHQGMPLEFPPRPPRIGRK